MTGVEVAIVMAVITAAATAASAIQANNAAEKQADILNQQAEGEEIRGLEEGNELLRNLIARDAANNARGGQAGLTLTGSFDDIQDELFADAERNLRISRANAAQNKSTSLLRASQARAQGKQALISGLGKSASSLVSAGSGLGGTGAGITGGAGDTFIGGSGVGSDRLL